MNQTINLQKVQRDKIPQYRPRYQLKLIPMQVKAYNLLLYGLKSLREEEIAILPEYDKRLIIYNTDRAWKVIGQLKQEKMNSLLNRKIKAIIPEICGNTIDLLFEPITDTNFHCLLKECEVSQPEIIKGFIEAKLLPTNFLK